MQFVEFMSECRQFVQSDSSRQGAYNALFASCSLLTSATGPGDGTSGGRTLCATDHVVCKTSVADPRGGVMPGQCTTECRKKPLPTAQRCVAPAGRVWRDNTIAEHEQDIKYAPVMVYGVNRDPSTNAASKRLYDESICFRGKGMGPDMEAYLRCRYPDDTNLEQRGFNLRSWIFFGGKFFGHGYTLANVPSNELERRLTAIKADRTCGKAARPPPPPPGQVNACVRPGSTKVIVPETIVPHQCQQLKARLPKKTSGSGLKCDTFADSGPWNDFLECAFRSNNWAKFRHGGQGGCGGPTLFSFCETAFAGDPDAIRCCSNSRCAWSASLFGAGGGHPYCITDKYAVNVCCEPCPCWLSPRGVTPGGRGNMTIIENYHGRTYPVLVNSDGLAVAAPFKCGTVGLFGNTGVTPRRQWQRDMGDCSHDPMGGR